jgi:hypothetical protein
MFVNRTGANVTTVANVATRARRVQRPYRAGFADVQARSGSGVVRREGLPCPSPPRPSVSGVAAQALDVVKVFGEPERVEALRGVSLALPRGAFTAVPARDAAKIDVLRAVTVE